MGDFDVDSYCAQFARQALPPYRCPVADCGEVFIAVFEFREHLAHVQHSGPIPPLEPGSSGSAAAKNSFAVQLPMPRKTGNKLKKRRGRKPKRPSTPAKESRPEKVDYVAPFDIPGQCQIAINDKVFRFDVNDQLPILSRGELLKRGMELKTNSRTTEILASQEKCKENIKKLLQASFYKVANYKIPDAPPMPKSYIKFVKKSAYELENEVEYSVDEEDIAWLGIMNKRRASAGLVEVSTDSFELLMDRLERESHFIVQTSKREDDEPNDDEAVCSVCLDGDCTSANVIIFCDMCNLAVHQDCYGVPYVPVGQWLCRRCINSPSCEVVCVLCPNKCGAFKQTDKGLWTHVTCALWIPEVQFANTVFLEPVNSIQLIPKARWKLVCYICKQRSVGACIQCSKTSCYKAFHVTCAQLAGLCMKMKTVSSGDSEPDSVCVEKIAFCQEHVPVDYLNKNSGRQLHGEQSNDASVLAKRRSAVPVTAVPTIPKERVEEIAKLLVVPENTQFVQRLFAYWTIKRHMRFGASLLHCLPSVILRPKEPISSKYVNEELNEMWRQFKHLKILRNDFEKVRLLCEVVIKRERIKYKYICLHESYTLKFLWPFNAFLDSVLKQLVEKDVDKIFVEPVDQNEVPDYGDIVKHPMDLQTMEIKINSCGYNSLEAFENDFNLMISNYLAYNAQESIYYKAGIDMKEQGKVVLRRAKRDLEVLDLDPVTMTFAKDITEDDDTTIVNSFSKTKEEIKDINEPEKMEVEINSLKRNDGKGNKTLSENLNFMTPESLSKSDINRKFTQTKSSIDFLASQEVGCSKQSTDHGSLTSYRSRQKIGTNDNSPSDGESSCLDSDSSTNSNSSSGSGSFASHSSYYETTSDSD